MCNALFPLLFIICVMQGLIICVRACVRACVCVLGWCVCVLGWCVCVCWGSVCVGVGGVEFRSLCVRLTHTSLLTVTGVYAETPAVMDTYTYT